MLVALLAISCKTPTERWLSGLAEYSQLQSASIKMEVMKMDTKNDTTILNYRVRIYPDKKWLENNPRNLVSEMNYETDSCFFIKAGGAKCSPGFVQPVANGIKGCYEYLISFNVDNKLKMRSLNLVYTDKYIDRQTHTLNLDKK